MGGNYWWLVPKREKILIPLFIYVLPSSSSYTRYRIDEGAFHNVCNKASEDPTSTAIEIINLAGTHCPIVICELAQICLTGPVGRMGSRAALRSVALILLDTVLRDMPHFSRALCLKGQALLPPEHGGWAPPMDETTCGTDGGNGNDNDNDNCSIARRDRGTGRASFSRVGSSSLRYRYTGV